MFDDISSFLADLFRDSGDSGVGDAASSIDWGELSDAGTDWGGLSGTDRWFTGESAPEASQLVSYDREPPDWGGGRFSQPGAAAAGTLAKSNAGGELWNDTKGWLSRAMGGDKTALNQMRFGLGGLGLVGSLFQSRKPRNQLSPAQLQAMLQTKYSNWTPTQQQSFNSYFNKPLSPLRLAGGGRAEPVIGTRAPPRVGVGGGAMSPEAVRAAIAAKAAQRPASAPVELLRRRQAPNIQFQLLERELEKQGLAKGGSPCAACGGLAMASGGSRRLVTGPSGGQDDLVDARLSPGEYVMDADIVSSLGDGNNAAGAARLDAMREHVRRHKRSGSTRKIPPKAKSPLAYMKGARRGA